MGRRVGQAIPMRGSQTFKDIVNHGATDPKIIPEIFPAIGENINKGRDTGLPGTRVDLALSLKLDLGIGPTGEWVVHKVEILSPKKELKAQPNSEILINQPKANKPISVKSWKPNKGPPKPIFEWRPRSTGQSVGEGPSGTKAEAESPLVNLELTDASSDDESVSESLLMVPVQDDTPSGALGDGILRWIGHEGHRRSGFWNSKTVNVSEFQKASDRSLRWLMIDSPGEFNSGLRSRGTEGRNLPRKKGNGSGRKRI